MPDTQDAPRVGFGSLACASAAAWEAHFRESTQVTLKPTMLSIHDRQGMEAYFRSRGLDLHLLRCLRNDFLKKDLSAEQAVKHVPPSEREDVRAAVCFHPLRVKTQRRSDGGEATKLVLEATDGSLIESVILRPNPARITLCVSCQVGCAGGCTFCATGRMGLVRQLSAAEILDQVVHAGQVLASEGRRRIRNVVFMGMGEPLQNEEALYEALSALTSAQCFGLSAQRMMVSTVGIPAAMLRFAERFPQVRLAVSLHSARQRVRERLVPPARRYPLAELRRAIQGVADIQQQEVMLEYLLLRGFTDSDDDLQALCAFVRGLPAWVNFIEYNQVEGGQAFAPTPDEVRDRFMDALKALGVLVLTRRSLGGEIGAACGQLAGRG